MDSSEVIKCLREHRGELARMGVGSLALFGSVARDEARVGSDVDLLVEFDIPVGLFEFLAVKERLEGILGVPVDLVTPGGLKPQFRELVLREVISAA